MVSIRNLLLLGEFSKWKSIPDSARRLRKEIASFEARGISNRHRDAVNAVTSAILPD
jgi:hypothetical protein